MNRREKIEQMRDILRRIEQAEENDCSYGETSTDTGRSVIGAVGVAFNKNSDEAKAVVGLVGELVAKSLERALCDFDSLCAKPLDDPAEKVCAADYLECAKAE